MTDNTENDADLDAQVEAFNRAYCRPYGPLAERDAAYWEQVHEK